MIHRYLSCILLLISFCNAANAVTRQCVEPGDFGIGGIVEVYANPSDVDAKALMRPTADEIKAHAQDSTKPLYIDSEVMKWTSTNFFTYGVGPDQNCTPGNTTCNSSRGVIKMYISGAWSPFTAAPSTPMKIDEMPECQFADCTPRFDHLANDSECFAGDGKRIVLAQDRSNTPCKISAGCSPELMADPNYVCSNPCSGYGLYGLIALSQGGKFADPNLNADVSWKPSTTSFRTFRVAPLATDVSGSCYAEIRYTDQCVIDENNPNNTSGNFICINDKNAGAQSIVSKGMLYFKIEDTHYRDNSGSYAINIVSGVYSGVGFIERTVDAFEAQMSKVTQGMYKNITGQFGFINIVRSLIYFYIVITGIMFLMGNINTTQGELVVRLFKVSLLLILISPSSFTFFNTYLFGLFTEGAQTVADIILNSTLYYNGDSSSPKFAMPEKATALSVYDIILNMVVSHALNAKIISLIFTKYCYLVLVFYPCIALIILGVIRAVMIYLTAIILAAVLLVIAPVFLTMILFQVTKQLFENWLNLLISTGMMIIAVSALLALMMTLIVSQIESLFYYKVCEQYIFSIFSKSPGYLNFYDQWFWYPTDFAQMATRFTLENILGFILIATVFEMVMVQIPQVIDALSKSQLSPLSRFSGATDKMFSMGRSTAENLRAAASVGLAAPLLWRGDNNAQFRGNILNLSKTYRSLKESKLAKLGTAIASAPTKGNQMLQGDAPHITENTEIKESITKQMEVEAEKVAAAWKRDT